MDFIVAPTPVSGKVVWPRVEYNLDRDNAEIKFIRDGQVIGLIKFEDEEELGDFLTALGDEY